MRHRANRASNPSNLTERERWGTAPPSHGKTCPTKGDRNTAVPSAELCVLGEYGGEAYYIGQARQDLVGTTRHFVPPFFTFDITPVAPPSTLGLLEGGRSTRY